MYTELFFACLLAVLKSFIFNLVQVLEATQGGYKAVVKGPEVAGAEVLRQLVQGS